MGRYMYNVRGRSWRFRAYDPELGKHVQTLGDIEALRGSLPEQTIDELAYKAAVTEYLACTAGFKPATRENPDGLHEDMLLLKEIIEQVETSTDTNRDRRIRNRIDQLTPLQQLPIEDHMLHECRRLRTQLKEVTTNASNAATKGGHN